MERFDSAIDQVRAKFPSLRVDVRTDASHVDAEARIPVQPGLAFPVSLSLQNGDELHRARLERPNAVGGWETITTWSNLVGVIPFSSRQNVIQNKVA